MKSEVKGFGNVGKGIPGITEGDVTVLRAGDVEIRVTKVADGLAINTSFGKKENKKEGL